MRDLKDVLLEDFRKDVNLAYNWNNYEAIIKFSLTTLLRVDGLGILSEVVDNVYKDFNNIFNLCPKFFNELMYAEYIVDKDNVFFSTYKSNVNLFCYLALICKHDIEEKVFAKIDAANFGFIDLFYHIKNLLESKNSAKIASIIEKSFDNYKKYYEDICDREEIQEMQYREMYNLIFLNLKAEIRGDILSKLISSFAKSSYSEYMNDLIVVSSAISEVIAVNTLRKSVELDQIKLSDFYFKDITDDFIKVVLD